MLFHKFSLATQWKYSLPHTLRPHRTFRHFWQKLDQIELKRELFGKQLIFFQFA
jgi:hypothetical protein